LLFLSHFVLFQVKKALQFKFILNFKWWRCIWF